MALNLDSFDEQITKTIDSKSELDVKLKAICQQSILSSSSLICANSIDPFITKCQNYLNLEATMSPSVPLNSSSTANPASSLNHHLGSQEWASPDHVLAVSHTFLADLARGLNTFFNRIALYFHDDHHHDFNLTTLDGIASSVHPCIHPPVSVMTTVQSPATMSTTSHLNPPQKTSHLNDNLITPLKQQAATRTTRQTNAKLPINQKTPPNIRSAHPSAIGATGNMPTISTANGKPLMYFRVLLMSGQFEKACLFLQQKPHFQVDAVHFAIALSYYGLLHISDSAPSSEGSASSPKGRSSSTSLPLVNFARLIYHYTRLFAKSAPEVAVQYLYLICLNADAPPPQLGQNQVTFCHTYIGDLAMETTSRKEILGDVRNDGTRIPGMIERDLSLIKLSNHREYLETIVKQAAERAFRERRLRDAICLFNIAEEYNWVIAVINIELASSLFQPGSKQASSRTNDDMNGSGAGPKGATVSLAASEDIVAVANNVLAHYDRTSTISSRITRKNRDTCALLLRLKTVVDLHEQGKNEQALTMLDSIDLLPTGNDLVQIIRKSETEVTGAPEPRGVINKAIATVRQVGNVPADSDGTNMPPLKKHSAANVAKAVLAAIKKAGGPTQQAGTNVDSPLVIYISGIGAAWIDARNCEVTGWDYALVPYVSLALPPSIATEKAASGSPETLNRLQQPPHPSASTQYHTNASPTEEGFGGGGPCLAIIVGPIVKASPDMDTLSTSGSISSFFSASFDCNVANSHPQQDAEVAERTVNPNIIRTPPVVNQYNLMTGLPPLPPESSTSASHSLPSLVNPNCTTLQTRYPADPFDRSHSSLTRIKALYLDSMSLIPFSGLLLTLAGDPQPRLGQGSSLFRPKPYSKPLSPPAGRKVSDSSRWSHDLFEDDSNLYGPKVRYQVNPSPNLISFGSPRPLPSLRPFGSTAIPPSTTSPLSTSLPAPSTKTNSLPTPAAQPVVSRECPAMKHLPQPPVVSSNSGISLLSRIQSSDTQKPLMASDSTLLHPSSSSGHPRPWKPSDASQITRPTPSPAAAHPEKKTHPAQNAKNQQALFDEAMAQYLNGPVILEVANLADGTSAKDVKTAFADFGEIQECSTEEGLRQANQPTLKARMIFTHKAQAEKAVDALNGALADGLPLAVKIVG
ncbi:hypothetical protein PCASD_15821 [Puccinia coronata f. sp. avenae]|uniref:RRM domain-containing protein n=1 Tax=Puccinia coronata f. sp. avenae TaxID=200324 RepID=A0A2N5SNL0_9BASI|nr:hypothetical protein PCASD_15821 [Puccinia coronata f. sp. avenae]